MTSTTTASADLFSACENGQIETIKSLLESKTKKVDIKNARDKDGYDVLYHACAGDQVETVKYLLDEVKVSLSPFACHWATSKGALKVLRYLVEKRGMDPFKRDSDFRTPLQLLPRECKNKQAIIDFFKERETMTQKSQ
eukprot:TRINITY_DN1173_c0_g2_i1.p1 TRINITY_DN1173_c0_g2~~TRINITY_DN1173_c0_g2_i1.p1  ORF type:complete len:139 (+),score=40.77 TRINITY_DN1173_c0_g2_i1:24-440(+)